MNYDALLLKFIDDYARKEKKWKEYRMSEHRLTFNGTLPAWDDVNMTLTTTSKEIKFASSFAVIHGVDIYDSGAVISIQFASKDYRPDQYNCFLTSSYPTVKMRPRLIAHEDYLKIYWANQTINTSGQLFVTIVSNIFVP